MRTKTGTTLILAATLLTLAIAPAAAADQPMRWLNVHVQEADEGANVKVHLPMTTVLAVMRAIDVDGFEAGRVKLDVDDADIDWPVLLAAVKDAPDGEFVTATTDDATVNIRKDGGTLRIDVTQTGDDHAEVRVILPSTLIDAFTVDADNTFDIAALVEGLADLPDGDLVQVDADDATVRIWIE
jgi:hypothetical protein